MRILYVVHQFYPQYISGTEQYVLALAREGRRAGDDVRVFTLDPDFGRVDPPTETVAFEHEGVPVVRYRFDKSAVENHALADWNHPEIGPPFERVLDDFRPELVHFFHFRWHGIDRIADVERRGIRFAVHLMDFWFVCPNFLLLRPGGVICDGPPDGGLGCLDCVHGEHAAAARADDARARYGEWFAAGAHPEHRSGSDAVGYALMHRVDRTMAALQRADLVISPSETVRDVFAAVGYPPENLVVVPYGIDREELGALPDREVSPITVGFLGTFAPHKGADVLVRAFRRIADPDLRLRLHGRFGDYPDFDAELRALADRDERIAFPGAFARDELPAVLGGLHVVVVPSRWRENTPFVCLEARAAGVDLVVSDLRGLTEAVPAGRGLGFRAGDSAHLAEILERAITAIRARGGRRLPPDDSIPTIAGQWRDFRSRYDELIAG